MRSNFPLLWSNLKTRTHSHDLTTYSQSLLVDVQRGGLKEDLTYILNKGVNAGSIFQNIKDLDDEKYGSLVIPDAYNRITWEQLASYHDLAKETGTSSISARGSNKREPWGISNPNYAKY